MALASLAQETLYVTGVVAAVGFVLWRAIQGQTAPGDVVLAIYLSQQVQTAVIWPIQAVTGLGETLRTAGRYLWLVDHAAGATPTGHRPAPTAITDGIRLENVSFRYPGTDRWVLRDVSLTIPAGSVLAVVGDNGAGKTTLVKLLTRMYEPTEGRITVDGVDLADLDVESWRRTAVGGVPGLRPLRVHRAARPSASATCPGSTTTPARARALETGQVPADVRAALPPGWTPSSAPRWDGGADLSTGQWQKLALASGLCAGLHRWSRFFDEPTASLDAFTEHALFEGTAAAARDAAPERHGHRAGVAPVLHRHLGRPIMVLADGTVAEFGPHATLLAAGDRYAALYRSQADAFTAD